MDEDPKDPKDPKEPRGSRDQPDDPDKTPDWVDDDPFPPLPPALDEDELTSESESELASDDSGEASGDLEIAAEPPPASSSSSAAVVGTYSTGDLKVEVDPSLTESVPTKSTSTKSTSTKAAVVEPAAHEPATETSAPEPRKPPKKAQTTSSAGRDTYSASGYAADIDTDPGLDVHRAHRYLGLPIYGWLLVAVVLLGALFLFFDLRKRNKYKMVCRADKVELHKGRTLPWPFGYESLGGPEFKPVQIPAESDCRSRTYHSREEAESGFLDFILSQARTALSNPGTVSLKDARTQVLQALLLTRTHRTRRKETQKMLAELAYREGRTGLARVENEIRTALARFQEAQKLDGDRFDDLDDWIEHLEGLLRTVAPSPTSGGPMTSPALPRRRQGGPSRTLYPPGISSPKRRLPQGTEPLPGAEPPESDAGPPESGGGILM